MCVSVTNENSESFLVKIVYRSGQKHDARSLSTKVLKEVSQEFDVKVRSFVTDNAANMQAMRKHLRNESECSIAT